MPIKINKIINIIIYISLIQDLQKRVKKGVKANQGISYTIQVSFSLRNHTKTIIFVQQ